MNAGINWTCDAIKMIAWLRSREERSESVSCELTLRCEGGGGRPRMKRTNQQEIFAPQHIIPFITTQGQPQMSAILFACVCYDTCDGWTHFQAHSWALVSAVSYEFQPGKKKPGVQDYVNYFYLRLSSLWKIHVGFSSTPDPNAPSPAPIQPLRNG